jgi:hypothetical protein
MSIRSKLLAAVCGVALMAGPMVFAGATFSTGASSAFALGPNATRAGFDTNTFAGNDDESFPSAVALPFSADFFGTTYNALYLNNNGNVTFDSPLSTYTPFDLSTTARVIIAAFFADVDTRVGNLVTFGNGTVDGHAAWGANWPGVGCFNQNDSVLDNFQLLLISRADVGAGDFDIEFNYDRIQWDSGQASNGDASCLNGDAARAGYSNGSAADSFEIPGSGVDNAFLDSNAATGLVNHSSNSSQLGRYVFSVRNGQPTLPTTLTTSLSGGSQTGAAITVPAGTPVTDSATLAGTNAASAGGTVTYTVYSDSACTTAVGNGGTKAVTGGAVGNSDAVTLSTPGTYYWQAAYSGDTLNNGSVSACGSETETVATPATLNVSSAVSPNPVTAGDNLVDTATITASGGAAHTVTAKVTSAAGGTVVGATPSQGSCAAPAGTTVTCALGTLASGASATVRAVVRLPGTASGTFSVTTNATSVETPAPGVNSTGTATVSAPSNSNVNGFVPPGGTIQIGGATPSAANNTVATFSLPNSGPGANMNLTTTPTRPTFCGGQPCTGLLLGFNDFSGYTNPMQPAVVRIRYDKSVAKHGLFSSFYVQKTPNGPATLIPNCAPQPGWSPLARAISFALVLLGLGPHSNYASPAPCVNAKIIGPGGYLEVQILALSGDPHIGLR